MVRDEVEVVVLGTGTSHGVPMIGCDCAVCASDDPRDRRTRCSIVVRWRGARFLIDTSPELRLQCLANRIDAVDAVLFTHHHADHVVGLDDLRRFNWLMKRELPCFGMPRTLERIERMFPYAFDPHLQTQSSKPELSLRPIGGSTFALGNVEVTTVPLYHGEMPVLGFRFGAFAYCTDCNRIPPEGFDRLRGVRVLILDALRRRPHPTHFTLEQALETADRIGAEQAFFTHMAHDLPHAETNASLPAHRQLAYDGQVIRT